MNLVARLLEQAAARPDALALRHRHLSWTFRELEARTARGAARLRSLGLRPGDPVLVFVPMGLPLYEILLSLLRMGAVAVFVDPSAGREHLARCCARIRPRALVGGPGAQLLRWALGPLRAIPRPIALGPWPFAPAWEGPAAASGDLETVAPEHPALITFTSGSTGAPKAAVRSHAFLLTQHRVLARALGHAPGRLDLVTLPIFALANLASGQASLIPDCDLRRPGAIDPDPVLAELAQYRPATTAASPAFLERLAARAEVTGQRLDSFQALHTGGAPVFPGLLTRLQALAPQAEVVAVYGSTEAEPIAELPAADLDAADHAAMTSGGGLLAGLPVPEIQVRILPDAWGRPLAPLTPEAFAALACAPGEAGEIVVQGDHVLQGYLEGHGDEETKFRVGDTVWHRTGDAGRWDARGRLWLLGRCSARIPGPDGDLWPFAVECAALQVPGVRRAALAQQEGRRLLAVEGEADLAHLGRALAWAHLDALIPVARIPLDRRHNAKVDYPALARLLSRRVP